MEPCDPGVYVELDEPTRSTNFIVSNSTAENDYIISMGWYRSISSDGQDMPTEAVSTGQCNAYAPIWLNGMIQ